MSAFGFAFSARAETHAAPPYAAPHDAAPLMQAKPRAESMRVKVAPTNSDLVLIEARRDASACSMRRGPCCASLAPHAPYLPPNYKSGQNASAAPTRRTLVLTSLFNIHYLLVKMLEKSGDDDLNHNITFYQESI